MYTRVESKFWQDEKMRAVSDDARYLMLYLLTSPHRNILGFYFLPSPYACFDLGWDEKRFKKALQELLQIGRIKYDAHAHVVLVQNYIKHNPLENPNQVKSAIERLEEIPQTQLFQDFLAVVEQFNKPFIQPLVERLQERLRKQGTGTGTGTETVTETGTGNINICAPDGARAHTRPDPGSDGSVEAEEVTATSEDKPSTKKSGPRSPFKSKRQEQLFDEFWERYPKKRSKGRAEKTWVKICPDDELFEAIMTGLDKANASTEWQKDGGQYIPHPSSWLNAKGWEDEFSGGDIDVQNNNSDRFRDLYQDGGTYEDDS